MLHNLIYLSGEFVNWKCDLRISLASIWYTISSCFAIHIESAWKESEKLFNNNKSSVQLSFHFISFLYYCKVFKDISSIFQEWKRLLFPFVNIWWNDSTMGLIKCSGLKKQQTLYEQNGRWNRRQVKIMLQQRLIFKCCVLIKYLFSCCSFMENKPFNNFFLPLGKHGK